MKRINLTYILQFIFMLLSALLMGFALSYSQIGSLKYTFSTVTETYVGMYLITSLILFLVYLGFYAIFNRFFYSTALFYVLFGIYAIANRLKVMYRTEPVLPSDLIFLKSFKELVSMVSSKIIIIMVIVLGIIIFSSILLEKFFGKKMLHMKWWLRIVLMIIPVITIGSFYSANDESSVVTNILNKAGRSEFTPNLMWETNSNGPLITFLSNIHVKVMDKPDGYNEAKIDSIVKKYKNVATEINKSRPNNDVNKQTLIFVLSESFADPTRVPNVKLNQDPIPNVRQIMKNNTSGMMLSSGYGGGTANMEYMSFTGLAFNQFSKSLQTPYVQLVQNQKNPENITNQFENKNAIHPYIGNFYNRSSVYNRFGFQTFRNTDSTGSLALHYTDPEDGSQYISDASAYKDVTWQVNQVKQGQFISLVTMQNHMPYYNNYQGNNFKASGSGVGKNAKQVANFAKGLNLTDEATQSFLDELNKINKPITVVFYGDHLPGIYDGNSMRKYNVSEHETEYFIYSNKYAIDHNMGTTKLNGNAAITDPNGFIPLTYQQMKEKVTPFYALLTKIQEDAPAMAKSTVGNSESLYVNKKSGKKISYKDLTASQKELLNDYKLIQYDLTAGKGYSNKLDFTK
ncbi:LTA synthase family protein [Companilactobacillus mishanensis]|uniref:LTA synthase family protein n=1 Tax=Companilactobacillus mishanensis TaxID=2486008 RepID=UPI000F786F87|nr:alkaline phosphatase family protein [Companilactobacillus mishanensis]